MFDFSPGSSDPGRHPSVPAEDLFGHLERYRINENVMACSLVHTAAAIWYERMRSEHELVAAGARIPVSRSVEAEIATVLGCSATVAHTMIEVGIQIQSRFPRIYASFDDGTLDYARVRTVVTTLREACDATVAAIECEVRAAARQLTPGPLRAEIWRLWSAANPTEAAAVRAEAARTDRTAYVRRGDSGMSWLSACITDIEGVEADALLDEIAATVCPGDPRGRGALRADGLMALLHGERILRCQCEEAECPTRAVVVPPRRAHLVQILIDVHTLLGLSADPARLADGTPLDSELARTLAADATWQAILTELRTAAETVSSTGDSVPVVATRPEAEAEPAAGTESACDTATSGGCRDDLWVPPADDVDTAVAVVESDSDAGVDDRMCSTDKSVVTVANPIDAGTESACDTKSGLGDDTSAEVTDSAPLDDESVWDPPPIIDPPPVHTPRPISWIRGVKRGRKHRRPGTITPPAAHPCPHVAPGVGTIIDAILAALAADPTLRAGVDPTGHGHSTVPPPGALTYRATAETLALVRAIYPTCVFPGCQVPAAKCELDHRVPYCHEDPETGGWTIMLNTQPLCKGHHDVKTRRLWTCVPLAGGAILWTSPRGTLHVTLPAIGYIGLTPDTDTTPPTTTTDSGVFDPVTPDEADELLYQPTWWEHHFGDDSPPLTPADIADDDYLYERYRQHKDIVRRRDAQMPPPF